MKQFKVIFKRTFVEYGECIIEADNEDDARDIARDGPIDDLDPEWGQQELDEECLDSVEEVEGDEDDTD